MSRYSARAATDSKLMEELGLEPSRYEGPTGIVGVLHDACRRDGLASVSLWAAVPHYVSLAPSPRAALALCQRLGIPKPAPDEMLAAVTEPLAITPSRSHAGVPPAPHRLTTTSPF